MAEVETDRGSGLEHDATSRPCSEGKERNETTSFHFSVFSFLLSLYELMHVAVWLTNKKIL